jgi:formate-dependent phosphoribosylglycinamide formyltransferase (GAR transformylase)
MRRVEGSVPKEYELPFEGSAVTAALRKQEPGEGTLGVEVLLDGEEVASRETSTTPGVLNLVWTSQ